MIKSNDPKIFPFKENERHLQRYSSFKAHYFCDFKVKTNESLDDISLIVGQFFQDNFSYDIE